ncbi:MAG TPA: NUDIX domain-containing protein [Leptospiraceae bacterium]|nr:NUDIX domain-containing protein [Leptospiraceae bacterium]HMW03559.1 NUDIX domain-containing protein [Leptospiraceae bacterium]HMX35011.1 NUDIX domain-containing protein [Leptospiraceae bacterium]HMY29520.1 NUDIX domain-containing protein [Leptospiraceae bacterium]HMZ63559.1 NUDIX domain-containing protein [Leptospiraceae bacterium]
MSKHGLFQITQKVFIRKDDLLLVMKDKKSGAGDLPGGRMNQDEFFGDWMDSLKRELEEELGSEFQVDISPKPILVHKHLVNDGNHPCVIVGYSGVYRSGEISISDEHDFFKWVDVKTYQPDELFSEYMLDAVKLYLKEFA